MAEVQGLTRSTIRQNVGYNLNGVLEGALFVGSVTADPSGGADSSSVIDAKLRGAADEHNGKWVVATSGSNAGEIVRVDDTVIDAPSSGDVDLTVVPSFSNNVAIADTYELWDDRWPPARINSLINQAIGSLAGRYYDPTVDTSLMADGKQSRFSLPSDIYMLRRVEKRTSFVGETILSFADAMDETVNSIFTVTVDSEITQGGKSNKLAVSGASDGDIVTDSFTAKNLSKYTHVEMWIRVSSDVAAGDLIIQLDDTAGGASPIEQLSIPAVTASERWKRVRIALSTPHLCTAIVSAGIEYNANSKANNIWVEGLQAIDADSEVWEVLPWRSWNLDKENRELLLKYPASVGKGLLRLVGGDKPALLTTDTATCEVPEEYVQNYVTSRALLGHNDENGNSLATIWVTLTEQERQRMPLLTNVRKAY